jgi:hypothetical protein
MEFHTNQKAFQETHIHSKYWYGHPLSQILYKSQEKVENTGKIIYTFQYNKAFTAPVNGDGGSCGGDGGFDYSLCQDWSW